jgi:hypothetical protein
MVREEKANACTGVDVPTRTDTTNKRVLRNRETVCAIQFNRENTTARATNE